MTGNMALTLTVAQAAEVLRVSEQTVRRRIKGGELPALEVGKGRERRHYRITVQALNELMEAKR